ncbi:MerR family transcriptional regulator [Streptomyces sp. NPDC047315]|uniref:MerR family transcriptional regulator n=1 Tax=Streptomyces sp. NPDC047315 TaxID=3155142 RepID=UPI0033C6A418
MRIGELSRCTGVPVPTIKYYLREGLLPAGELTSPNQAAYGDEHVRRLRLIRALLDVGGLKIAAIAEILAAVDDPDEPVHHVLGVASDLLVARPVQQEEDAARESAVRRVEELIRRRGWRVAPDGPGAELLAGALASMERLGHGDFRQMLETYADAAEQVARADLEYVAGRTSRDVLVQGVVVGTVLGDAVLDALRQMAQTDQSARRYGVAPPGGGDGAARDG